jgi:hypothetical protein
MDMQAFQVALNHLVFQVVLYLFVGAVLMLLRNEIRRGMTERDFTLGMVLWPAVVARAALLLLLIAIRGARG